MLVELLDATESPEYQIGRAAAYCYNSSKDQPECVRRTRSAVGRGHDAVLRFAYATFGIEQISRVCSHELVRIAHMGILQESQRYVGPSCLTITPPSIPPEFLARCREHEQASLALYLDLRKAGVAKGDARYYLTESTVTKLALTGNFQAWLHFIKLRTDRTAHWEIRAVAQEIQRQLAFLAPSVFDWASGLM